MIDEYPRSTQRNSYQQRRSHMFGRMMLACCLLGVAALFIAGCSDNTTPVMPGNSVTLTVINDDTGQPSAPSWVAFQDGATGSWRRLRSSNVPGVFTAGVADAAGAYGFAVAVNGYDGTSMYYLQATLADAAALTLPVNVYLPEAFTRNPAQRMLRSPRVTRESSDWEWNGTASGLPSSFDYETHADAYGNGSFSPVSGSFLFYFRFPAGRPSDASIVLNHSNAADGNDLLFLRRNMTHAAGSTIDDGIDFSAPWDGSKDTWELTQEDTVSMAGAESISANYLTANGTTISLNGANGSSCTYPLIPADAMEDGDLYQYGGGVYDRNLLVYSRAPFTSLTLPSAFSCEYAGQTFSGLTAEDADLYEFYLGGNGISWLGWVTPAWLAAADTTSMTFPHLTDVDGWEDTWGFSEGNPPAYVSATKVEYNTSLASYLLYWLPGFLQDPPADGNYIRWSADYFGNN